MLEIQVSHPWKFRNPIHHIFFDFTISIEELLQIPHLYLLIKKHSYKVLNYQPQISVRFAWTKFYVIPEDCIMLKKYLFALTVIFLVHFQVFRNLLRVVYIFIIKSTELYGLKEPKCYKIKDYKNHWRNQYYKIFGQVWKICNKNSVLRVESSQFTPY